MFNQAGAAALPQENIDEKFFELDKNDMIILYQDAKKKLDESINAPLQTSAQRELEKNKAQLSMLNKYKKVVIRIQFPNQLVLQGLFKPIETIQDVIDFVKIYLEHPETDFSLCKN